MKKFLLFVIGIILLPLNVFAKNDGYIQCEHIKLKNSDEVECKIYVSNMDFIITSISGSIKLDDNLELKTHEELVKFNVEVEILNDGPTTIIIDTELK